MIHIFHAVICNWHDQRIIKFLVSLGVHRHLPFTFLSSSAKNFTKWNQGQPLRIWESDLCNWSWTSMGLKKRVLIKWETKQKQNTTKRNETKCLNWETKQNRICKLKNETKRDHTMNCNNLEDHSSTSASALNISSIAK